MFPENPTPGQQHTVGGVTYSWNGSNWIPIVAGPASPTATSTTTTVPSSAAGGTGGNASPIDLAGIIKGLEALGLTGGSQTSKTALGLTSGKLFVDKSTGRVISYTGPTKDIPGGPQDIQPKYFEGDEYAIATWSPDLVAEWQLKLKNGGYFQGKTFEPGIVRESTIDAYKKALADANQSFIGVDEAIKRSETVPYSEGRGTALKTYRVTSGADLELLINKVSTEVLGREIDQQQVNALKKAYQQAEVSGAQAVGGVQPSTPQASTFAAQKIETQNQDEADAYKFSQYAQVFENLLRR